MLEFFYDFFAEHDEVESDSFVGIPATVIPFFGCNVVAAVNEGTVIKAAELGYGNAARLFHLYNFGTFVFAQFNLFGGFAEEGIGCPAETAQIRNIAFFQI